jgi:transcriptional antiterminator RfaH
MSGPGTEAVGVQRMLRWFLVLTKPAAESTAQSNLQRQGYHVYYPQLIRPVLRRGRWVDRVVALFPRYLFVHFDTVRQSMGPVRSTLGVSGIVHFGAEAARVPDEIVDELRSRADPASGLHRLQRRRGFDPGASVSVIAGALEGLHGIFERAVGEDRAVILLNLVGRRTPVCVEAGLLACNVSC